MKLLSYLNLIELSANSTKFNLQRFILIVRKHINNTDGLPSIQIAPTTHYRSSEQPKHPYYTGQKNHG